jgi:hypothetical protein
MGFAIAFVNPTPMLEGVPRARGNSSRIQVFKKYSQMKLQMQREALTRLNRHAGDSGATKHFDTEDSD